MFFSLMTNNLQLQLFKLRAYLKTFINSVYLRKFIGMFPPVFLSATLLISFLCSLLPKKEVINIYFLKLCPSVCNILIMIYSSLPTTFHEWSHENYIKKATPLLLFKTIPTDMPQLYCPFLHPVTEQRHLICSPFAPLAIIVFQVFPCIELLTFFPRTYQFVFFLSTQLRSIPCFQDFWIMLFLITAYKTF